MRRLAALVLMLAAVVAFSGSASAAPPIKHVFILMLENKGFDRTFGRNSPAPYLSQTLPRMGALLPNYYGVTHESLGNYIALVSGQGSNVMTQSDCEVYTNVMPGTTGADGQAIGQGCVYPSSIKTIADQLTQAGMTWKGYMEDMGNGPASESKTCRHPSLGSHDPTQNARPGDAYAARHNPFVYFHSLIDGTACANNDVPLDRLSADLASASSTANYTFITPNLCNDGHDPSCAGGGLGGFAAINAFLKRWVPRILASPAYRKDGLLVVTFDESDGTSSAACCGEPEFPVTNTANNGGPFPGRGGGKVGAVLLSPFIDPGTVDHAAYNHFTLLRSIEDIFGLGHLGYAGISGGQSLGADAFTCYAPAPHARRGRLRRGSEIKLVTVGQGTARKPSVRIELWHPGRVTVAVARSGKRRFRTIARRRRAGACQQLQIRLRSAHGRVTVSARAYGGTERRTLSY